MYLPTENLCSKEPQTDYPASRGFSHTKRPRLSFWGELVSPNFLSLGVKRDKTWNKTFQNGSFLLKTIQTSSITLGSSTHVLRSYDGLEVFVERFCRLLT